MASGEKGRHHTHPTSRLKQYCLVGDDNNVYLWKLGSPEIKKLMSLDSHAIGIYFDQSHQYYYVLTKRLNFYFYNGTSYTLERVGGFEDACRMLCLDDIIENIFSRGNLLKVVD